MKNETTENKRATREEVEEGTEIAVVAASVSD
jgi:hypothetical protein